MKKIYISLFAIISFGITAMAQDYFDDIYYNPKKDTSSTSAKTVTPKRQSNYIANMADMDVDAYNRRGEQYYVSQIDTIGSVVENGEDFVYTQQIQKYYNPTIVVDNANVLGDVLSNAYGNVDIVINANGLPVFAPWYGWNGPYYAGYWSPWSWGFNYGPLSWSIGWYDPWYSWNWGWGPSWGWGPAWGPAWGPGWGPAWGPGWGPGPGFGPGPGPGWGPPMATWSPRGNRAVGPRPGWSAAPPRNNMAMSRPVSNYRGGTVNPASPSRPSGMHGVSRPSGVVNNGGRWEYNTTATTGHRVGGTGVLPGRNGQSGNVTVNRNGSTAPGRNNNAVTTNQNRNTNTTNRNVGTNNNRSSFGTGSRSTSSGGHSIGGGGRSTGGRGGGGGGRHR